VGWDVGVLQLSHINLVEWIDQVSNCLVVTIDFDRFFFAFFYRLSLTCQLLQKVWQNSPRLAKV
jgi:hypothetical protein